MLRLALQACKLHPGQDSWCNKHHATNIMRNDNAAQQTDTMALISIATSRLIGRHVNSIVVAVTEGLSCTVAYGIFHQQLQM